MYSPKQKLHKHAIYFYIILFNFRNWLLTAFPTDGLKILIIIILPHTPYGFLAFNYLLF